MFHDMVLEMSDGIDLEKQLPTFTSILTKTDAAALKSEIGREITEIWPGNEFYGKHHKFIELEVKEIAKKLDVHDQVNTKVKREDFLTCKDHKLDIANNPNYRLINPANSEIDKISTRKQILGRMNTTIAHY